MALNPLTNYAQHPFKLLVFAMQLLHNVAALLCVCCYVLSVYSWYYQQT